MNHSPYSSEYNTALAIVGMAGRFPGASSLAQFWQNIANKVSAIRQYSAEELLAAGVPPEDLAQPNYVRAGVVLENIEDFDASFFGISPREAELMDPQFRIFLECVWEVLETAGYDLATFKGLIGVFAGAGYKNYLLHHLSNGTRLLDTVSEFQMTLIQDPDVLATLVSYKLNLKGPSVSVQSFCSTSLVAVHLACQSLLNYECDMAVAGGVALNSLELKGYFYEEGKIVSPDGYCRPFDARAQGSILSNGAGVVALKRFQDALDDGDHIYAIIRGSALNNDGNQRVSYTAPGLDGQASVIASALSYARIPPETISYVETNGTGTRLGDAIELAAMTRAFAGKTQKKSFCAISSLKPNIGHLDRASGVAGLIKTVLAMEHRQVPPHLHYEQPSPELDLNTSPFYVNTSLTPWPKQQTPRRAGVNSFGLGGTNVHLVLEEGPECASSSPARSWQVFPLSARSAWSLQQANRNLVAHLKAHPEQSLADVAYTLQVGRSAFNYRQFVVANTAEEACAALEQKQALFTHQEHRDRPVAFLFPGNGEHAINIAHQLSTEEPHFRATIATCCQFLQTHLSLDLQTVLLPEQASASETSSHADEQLEQPAHRQLAAFIVEYALAQLLIEWRIRPQALFGYGSGEYVAACVAGVLPLEDALTLVAQQGQVGTLKLQKPQIPCLSPVTDTWLTKELALDPHYWVQPRDQATSLTQNIEALLHEPERVLLEVGAGEMLSTLVKQHPACHQERHVRIISLSTHHSDQAELGQAIGRLWLAGITIDWKRLFTHERRLRVPLPTYPFERQRCWVENPSNRNVVRQGIADRTREKDRADWFYLPYWEPTFPAPLPHGTRQPHEKNLCLIFVDASGVGTQVAQKLEQKGYSPIRIEVGETFVQQSENHFAIRPDAVNDYVALFNRLSSSGRVPNTIMHCWSVTDDEATPSHPAYFYTRQKMGFSSLLCLVKAIGQTLPDTPMDLLVVSNHIQAVTGQEFLRPEKAPILGVCKVINQECPSLTCRSIDIADVQETNRPSGNLLENLAAECLLPPAEVAEFEDMTNRQIAYRGHTRWIQRYTPAPVGPVKGVPPSLRKSGVYLLIGGLGEIGLLLAEYLAAKVHARLMLVDSSPCPDKDQWSDWLTHHPQDDAVSQIIQRLQALEALGAEVRVLQADLADAVQVKQTVEQTLHQFGALQGVLLLPRNADLQIIQDVEQASHEAYIQQAYSLFALEQALQGIALDFCLMCSSLAGVWGDAGSVFDAATGVFMDAFAFKQSQTSSTLWISANWDLWQTRAQEQRVFSPLASRYMLSPEEGVDVFSRILTNRFIRTVVSTGKLHERFEQWLQVKSDTAISARPAAGQSKRPEVSTAYVPPESPTEQKIVELWQLLLGFEQIGIHDNFFELHGHSLLGMQLIARLRQIFQVNIPLIKLFDGPTVTELADVVEALIIEEIEKLDEEEARMLI